MTTKDDEILRLRLALQRSHRLLRDAGNALAEKGGDALVERLHHHADKLRDIVSDVDAPLPTAEAELRALLQQARTYLERGGRYVRTGTGLLDDIDAAIGPHDGGESERARR